MVISKVVGCDLVFSFYWVLRGGLTLGGNFSGMVSVTPYFHFISTDSKPLTAPNATSNIHVSHLLSNWRQPCKSTKTSKRTFSSSDRSSIIDPSNPFLPSPSVIAIFYCNQYYSMSSLASKARLEKMDSIPDGHEGDSKKKTKGSSKLCHQGGPRID